MIPEVGHFALILSFVLAAWQSVLPTLGLLFHRPRWAMSAVAAARGQFLFLSVAYICLTAAFIRNDFSLLYVAANSNTKLPLLYRVAGVWGAHEGSLLLWVLLLAAWGAALSLFDKKMPPATTARVLTVMGMISAGFIAFTLFTSNPFLRLAQPPAEGRDLNPLLQDFALAIHPPFLYMGYVGFAVAFAFAVSALCAGKMDSAWARWARPWTMSAWIFLTIGITLGSWWAYYELGWGGWWFWDPVENASLMPWLLGTALLHSLAATDSRGAFKSWTALLALLTFSFCLLGAFLVRSGVLTSVHSFADDPARGVFILLLLALAVGGGLSLFAWRTATLRAVAGANLISREGGILANNLFLTAAACTVLVGTLYPLVLEILRLGKISVGAPYFNSVFLPLTIPLAILMGVGANARWKNDSAKRLFRRLSPLLLISVAGGAMLPLLENPYRWAAAAGLSLSLWIALATAAAVRDRSATAGMATAHIGLAVFIVGVTLSTVYSAEKFVVLSPNEKATVGDYAFVFGGVQNTAGENFSAQIGEVVVWKNGEMETVLYPQKRFYPPQKQTLTEAAIDASPWRDIYISLGDAVNDETDFNNEAKNNGELNGSANSNDSKNGGGAWTLQLRVKPFVRWIWGGALLMALGGALTVVRRFSK